MLREASEISGKPVYKLTRLKGGVPGSVKNLIFAANGPKPEIVLADAVSNALADIQINTLVPIIHGVLLFENEEQARERCFGTTHNRGTEAARVALEMLDVMRSLKKQDK